MSVGYTLHLSCEESSCDNTAAFRGDHFFDVQMSALREGWRFSAAGDQAWCYSCAIIKFPELFVKKKSSARKVKRR